MPIRSLVDEPLNMNTLFAESQTPRRDEDDFEPIDDGEEVELSPSFQLHNTDRGPPPHQHVATSPAAGGCFLYLERGRGAQPHYQYHAQPSPGDLKRIAAGRLTVFMFDGGNVLQFQPDGTTKPVTEYAKFSAPKGRRTRKRPVENRVDP